MFVAGYSFASLCLVASLALLFALALRLADRQLRILGIVPSPLAAWQFLCQRMVQKLNRPGRSSATLKSRGYILILTLLALSAFIGNVVVLLLAQLQNDYAETLLLALVLLALPTPVTAGDDPAAHCRHQIESDVVRLLQRILGPVTGWLLFGWPGVFLVLTTVYLRNSVTQIQTPLANPIRRLSQFVMFLPGLLGIGLLTLAAFFTSKGKPLDALRAGLEKMLKPYVAVTLTIAEALGLSLAGPTNLHPDLLGREWLGHGIARLQPPDVKRWQWHLTLTQSLFIALLLLLSLLL